MLLIIFGQDIQTVVSEFSVLLFMGVAIPSILLPIVFKLGYIKAKIVSAIIIVLFMAVTILINTKIPSNELIIGIYALQEKSYLIGIYAPQEKSYLNAIVAVILLGISMLLSINFYKKREF